MGVRGPAQAWRPRPGPTAAASLRLRDWTRPGAERVEKAARPSLRDTQGTRAPLGPERGCGACTRPPPASAPSHWPSYHGLTCSSRKRLCLSSSQSSVSVRCLVFTVI